MRSSRRVSALVQYLLRALTRAERFRQQGVVRPDTRVQFHIHVVAQYIVGRLLSRSLSLRVEG